MGWMYDLFQTYENNIDQVGKFEKTRNNRKFTLLPIGHTTQNAQIELTVDEKGNFYQAKVIEKDDASTVIPCTEASFSRTRKPVPHPLHDKLMYVAGDFKKYGGKIEKGSPYEEYLDQLHEWSESVFANDRVKTIYKYMQKGTLIEDLVKCSIISLDKENQMIAKWTRQIAKEYGEKPQLFKVLNDSQDKVFIRFNTYKPGEVNSIKLWEDEQVYNSFIRFYEDKLQENDLCYVSGVCKPRADKHASGLRRAGDSAKLISANDTSGLTYRGRFVESTDVANISYEVSQKAHNALKWLILKQGKTIDGRVFLVWGCKKTNIPAPQEDVVAFFKELGCAHEDKTEVSNTHEMFAEEVNKAIEGYKSDLSYKSQVSIMLLDAATTGRLSVLYYRTIDQDEYLDRIKRWHLTCSWLHPYWEDKDKKPRLFYGAPATKDIAKAAYGFKVSDNLVKGVMERILPCIVENQKIPLDIVRNAFYRASNPVSMKNWQWEKTLSIACSLIHKFYDKEGFEVSLDLTNKNRDYLFGRLLAVADVLERSALPDDEKRASNALRYMNAFARHPARTWKIIQTNLQPYQAKLGDKAIYFNSLIDDIASNIAIDDFNNKPLHGIYLLGFYSQRHELYRSKK